MNAISTNTENLAPKPTTTGTPANVRQTGGHWALIPLAMGMTVVALAIGRLAYGLLLPAMRDELGHSVQQAGNLATASSLGYLILVVPAGLIASRRGPRLSILIGTVLLLLACLGLALSYSYTGQLLAMLMMGFGTALLYTPLIALVVGWFPTRRGMVIGLANAGVGIGSLASGLLVPLLISDYGVEGHRIAWYLFAAFTLLVLILTWRFAHNPPGFAPPKLAGRELAQQRHSERKSVLQNSGIRLIAGIYGVLGITYIVQSVFMYSYALEAGIDPVRAGAMVSTMGLVSIFAGTVWGALSDYIGRSVALMLNFSITLLVTVLPVLLPTNVGFTVHFAVSGIVVGGLFTVILAATSERVEPRLVPVAVSLVTVVFALGQLIGPAAAARLIEWSGRYEAAFVASSLLMFGGIYLSYRLWLHERT